MKSRPRFYPFGGKGLSTTAYGPSALPDEWSTFQDVEVDHGDAEIRGGRALLTRTAAGSTMLAFDGTNDRVDFPSGLALDTILGLYWTIEILFQTTSIGSDRVVIGKYNATVPGLVITHTSTSTVTVAIRDSAGTTTTLTHTGIAAGTLCGLQIVRSGASLTSYLNGDTQTGTMSATNLLASGQISAGTTNGASWFPGTIDYFRGWTVARSTRADLYFRRMNPRHRDCRWDFVFEDTTAHDVVDRGRFQYHAQTQGSPTWNAAPLAVNPVPVQALAYNQRKNGTREIIAVVGGTAYAATVS